MCTNTHPHTHVVNPRQMPAFPAPAHTSRCQRISWTISAPRITPWQTALVASPCQCSLPRKLTARAQGGQATVVRGLHWTGPAEDRPWGGDLIWALYFSPGEIQVLQHHPTAMMPVPRRRGKLMARFRVMGIEIDLEMWLGKGLSHRDVYLRCGVLRFFVYSVQWPAHANTWFHSLNLL